MTPSQHPEPTEVVGLEGVLAAHRAHVGPITGAWKCHCGVASTNGDLRAGTLTTMSERADEHRAHVAEQVRAWLGERLASEAVEKAASKAVLDTRRHRWESPHQGHCILDARAALTAITEALA